MLLHLGDDNNRQLGLQLANEVIFQRCDAKKDIEKVIARKELLTA